jgi:linoleoyl-CoA desaturase
LSVSAKKDGKAPIRNLPFTQHRNFQKTVNERVNAYLQEHNLPRRDLPGMYLKSGLALVWWLAAYLLLILGHFSPLVNLGLCLIWAFAIASIGFNVTHDANHDGFSNHRFINRLVSLSGEMLGMSSFRWRVKHNVWHHTYTNIAGYDDDVETFGLMRLTPRAPWKPHFRFQFLYFPLVYSLIGFDFILRDFMMVLTGKSDANHVYPRMTASDKAIFWGGKLFYFTVMLGLPLLVFPWWQVLIGWAVVMLTAGLILGVVFQLAHISAETAFPEPVGSPVHIENEWAVHQVQTTANFAPSSRLLNFYVGGLNYQIEHHLLPHICHLNYPKIAPIVRATCEEFGIRYNVHATWSEAFASHLRELRLLGCDESSAAVPAV